MDDNGLSRLRAGNHAAWQEVYTGYRSHFISWITHKYGCSAQEARDVFQETLMVLNNRIRSGKIKVLSKDLTTLLFDIGKNKVVDIFRKESGFRKCCIPFSDEDLVAEEQNPEKDDVKKFRQSLMSKCLEELTDCERNFILLCLNSNLGFDEIAKKTGLKNASVARQRKFKIMTKIEKLFKKLMNGGTEGS